MKTVPHAYCGMPCALCTQYRVDGPSRCLGCSADGMFTQTCKVIRCARERNLNSCGECEDYPCPRYDHAAEDTFFAPAVPRDKTGKPSANWAFRPGIKPILAKTPS